MSVDCGGCGMVRDAGGVCTPPLVAAQGFEKETLLGYSQSLKNEDEAPHSYRSGKSGGVGVPAGGGAALDAALGDGMAGRRNELL